MENHHSEELRIELDELFCKQREILESRMLGAASDADVLAYEIRQRIIHEIIQELCNVISHSPV